MSGAAPGPSDRLRYTAAIDRPAVLLPGGKGLAIWPVVNVEHWLIDAPMPRQVLVAPTGRVLPHDLPNWAWHEYGMRVGFWRILQAFAARGIRPTLSVNASVCTAYPRVATAARDAGWEFMGHGFVQMPTQLDGDEAGTIARAVEAIRAFTGAPPAGWLGPGLTETPDTPDLLASAGIRYVADWVVDDRPCRLHTAGGTLFTMPYSVELNDIPVLAIQHRTAEDFAGMVARQADRLGREAAADGPGGGAKVLSFAVHPYLFGVPHRIAALEGLLDALLARPDAAFMQGNAILDWYEACGDPA